MMALHSSLFLLLWAAVKVPVMLSPLPCQWVVLSFFFLAHFTCSLINVSLLFGAAVRSYLDGLSCFGVGCCCWPAAVISVLA